MQRSFSRRCYPCLLIVCLNLVASLLLQRAEAVFLSLPFLAVLLLDLWTGTSPALQLRHCPLPAILCEGEEIEVMLDVTAMRTVPLLEVLEILPSGFICTHGHPGAVLSLARGESQRLACTVQAQHRGRWLWEGILLRSYSPGRLIVYDGQWPIAQNSLVYPPLTRLRRIIAPRQTQLYSGDSVSRRAGEGIEFTTLRPYVYGDAPRHINWRTSQRRGTLHVNQYAVERNADIVLLLDTLTNAGNAQVNTLDYCIQAAAALATAYVRRRDRVGLIEYSGACSWVPPASGRRHLARLLERLAVAQVHLSYVHRDLSLVPRRILPPQALVVALTALIDARFMAALEDLAGRRFEVLVLAISPAAVLRTSGNTPPLDTVACQLWELEHQTRLITLQRFGMAVFDWTLHEPLAVLVQRVLHVQRRHKGRRL